MIDHDAMAQILLEFGAAVRSESGTPAEMLDEAMNAVDAITQDAQKTPTREQIAEALHDHDHMHTWRGGRCDDACGLASFQRADAVTALFSTTSTEGETQS